MATKTMVRVFILLVASIMSNALPVDKAWDKAKQCSEEGDLQEKVTGLLFNNESGVVKLWTQLDKMFYLYTYSDKSKGHPSDQPLLLGAEEDPSAVPEVNHSMAVLYCARGNEALSFFSYEFPESLYVINKKPLSKETKTHKCDSKGNIISIESHKVPRFQRGRNLKPKAAKDASDLKYELITGSFTYSVFGDGKNSYRVSSGERSLRDTPKMKVKRIAECTEYHRPDTTLSPIKVSTKSANNSVKTEHTPISLAIASVLAMVPLLKAFAG